MRTAQQDLGSARRQLDKWQAIAGFAFTEKGRAWAGAKAATWAARVKELEQETTKETEKKP